MINPCVILLPYVKWLGKSPHKGGRQDTAWASTEACAPIQMRTCIHVVPLGGRTLTFIWGISQVLQIGVMLEGRKAFRCGQTADNVCRSRVTRNHICGYHHSDQQQKFFVFGKRCLGNRLYILKINNKGSTNGELSPVQKRNRANI